MNLTDINYKYNKNILNNITESFINDYKFWKNVIESTNKAIKLIKDTEEYTYDEFCKNFLEHLNDNTEISQIKIQEILIKMINEKTK